MELAKLAEILKTNGIVGCGGAGFPTYAKLDQRADTIIMNCAECEPLLKLHQQLLGQNTYDILYAFAEIGKAVGATDLIIGIKNSYVHTIQSLQEEIGKFPGMRVKLLDKIYPAGDEVVLIYEATGRVVRPGGLPIEQGVAVFNVETCYNLLKAMQGSPVVDKLVTITGEVKTPVTVRLPLGTTVEKALEYAGGVTVKNPAFVMGGVMMGGLGSYKTLITKTTNAIIVLPEDHLVVTRKKQDPAISLKRAAASCCQCQMCTDLCPRHALGHPIQPHLFMRAATCKDVQDPNIFLNTFFCSSCGLCEMYSCFQGLSPRSLMAAYKAGLRQAGIKPPKVEAAPVRPEVRQLRKAPVDRLLARLNLTRYNIKAPLDNTATDAEEVKIPTRMHIGAPANPVVKVGDKVSRGDLIAAAGNGLSVNSHASISGIVTGVSADFVEIKRG